MRLLDVGLGLPPHHVDQTAVTRTLGRLWVQAGHDVEAVERLHVATGVGSRYLTFPIDAYTTRRTFADTNDTFISVATDLGATAIRDALARTGLVPGDVDLLVVVSTTGVAAPSIDARLINRLGFRADVRRLPVVGLGCVGGAAGLARCAESTALGDDGVALLVCVELCSLTFQLDDLSIPNLVATGLFGDGAACAVIGANGRAARGGPRILGSRSIFHPETEDVLGWRIGDSGFRVVLRSDLPAVAVRRVPEELDRLLAEHRLSRADIGVWVVHPGGPKVLRTMEEALALGPAALRPSWASLRRYGNLSSASVLYILRDVLDAPPPAGTYGVVLGMGPGFSAEAVLLCWD